MPVTPMIPRRVMLATIQARPIDYTAPYKGRDHSPLTVLPLAKPTASDGIVNAMLQELAMASGLAPAYDWSRPDVPVGLLANLKVTERNRATLEALQASLTGTVGSERDKLQAWDRPDMPAQGRNAWCDDRTDENTPDGLVAAYRARHVSRRPLSRMERLRALHA